MLGGNKRDNVMKKNKNTKSWYVIRVRDKLLFFHRKNVVKLYWGCLLSCLLLVNQYLAEKHKCFCSWQKSTLGSESFIERPQTVDVCTQYPQISAQFCTTTSRDCKLYRGTLWELY